MNKVRNIKIFSVLILLVFGITFFSRESFANCCPGDSPNGYWFNGCCYSGGSDCCSSSGTCEPIPCENCGDDGGGDDGGGEEEPCYDCTLPSCPVPLTSTGDDEYELEDYVSCERSGSCAGTKYGDCYEPSGSNLGYPTVVSLTLTPPNNEYKGFTTSTVSGLNVNNTVKLELGVGDKDGVEDIEAVYVWFSKSSLTPTTPQYIYVSGTLQLPKTLTNDSWGFMLHKENGSWEPYIPSMGVTGQTNKWVRATKSDIGESFDIKGPNGISMVRVSNYSTPSVESIVFNPGPHAYMSAGLLFDMDMQFLKEDGQEKVYSTTDLEGYNIFAMGNDVFGFTPYDNYPAEVTRIEDYWLPGQIRKYNDWTDTSKDWKVDLVPPTSGNVLLSVITVEDLPYIKLEWTDFVDVQGMSGLVVDIVYNGEVKSPTIPVAINSESNFQDMNLKSDSDGQEIGNWVNGTFKVTNLVPTYALIDVSGYDTGSFTFHITGFDIGGNVAGTSDVFLLDDWVATRGGYVYSSGGSNIEIRDIVLGSWSGVSNLVGVGFNEDNVDITSEGVGVSSSSSIIPTPITSGRFGFRPYREYPSSSLYNELRLSFLSRVSKLGAVSTTLSGNELCSGGDCITPIYYADIFTDLSLNPGFSCNGKGVIFVSGNLVIRPNMEVGVEGRDGCIFVVSGNVSILDDVDATPGVFEYDEVNALILSDGTITVGNTQPSVVKDGLLVKGGMYAIGADDGSSTIHLERKLGLLQKNLYPVLAIYAQPAYRYLSMKAFGTRIDLQRVEVGYKPY